MNRVTQEQIDKLFDASEKHKVELWGKEYHLFIKLPNGFIVDGKGACVDPKNYSAEIGRIEAIKKIKNKLWELEGYLLQEKLFNNLASEEMEQPDIGDYYRHYKGNLYRIIPPPCDAFTGNPFFKENLIWYQCQKSMVVWGRERDDFLSEVVDFFGKSVKRFVKEI